MRIVIKIFVLKYLYIKRALKYFKKNELIYRTQNTSIVVFSQVTNQIIK
jgi:hypothetical protein